MYVEDHAKAIDIIFHRGNIGETYNVGGDCEKTNIDLIRIICNEIDFILDNQNSSTELIKFVNDRKGHDFRYAINSNKLQNELGWEAETPFMYGIKETINWYIKNIYK